MTDIDSAEKMSCQELVELVTEYFEGALGGELLRAFEAHISECDGCTAYLEQMRQTIALTGRLTADHIPPEAEGALLRAFRHWRSS